MKSSIILEVLPSLGKAALLTLNLTFVSVLLGLVVAVPLGLMRASSSKLISAMVLAYTFILRGTPLLVQVFLIYYGLSQLPWVRDSVLWTVLKEPYWCALLAFSLNHSAYATEIFRGGIRAVAPGEIEAAKALGMSSMLRTRRIVLPLAWRLALPAYANEVVLMLKASSLASTITLMELTGTSRKIVAETFSPYEVFIAAALIYLAITFVCIQAFGFIERRLNRHLLRPYSQKGRACEQVQTDAILRDRPAR